MTGTARRRATPGFTLVELLVVIAIVGMLVALSLPAVMRVREAARRVQCQSHLRQLALAVHNYHDTHEVLPISIAPWADGPRPTAQRNGKGWIVGVLPYLEQQPLYDELRPASDGDFFSGGGLRDLACREALKRRVELLTCPSDGSALELSRDQQELRGIWVRVTNYKGVLGDHQLGGPESCHRGSLPDLHNTVGCNGLFFRVSYQQPQRLMRVRDGTSQTLMLGEDVPEYNHRSAAFYANGDHASCHAPLNYFPDPPTPDRWEDVVGFRSRHPGGSHFATADGSVRFLSDDVDHATYRELATKASGQPVALP